MAILKPYVQCADDHDKCRWSFNTNNNAQTSIRQHTGDIDPTIHGRLSYPLGNKNTPGTAHLAEMVQAETIKHNSELPKYIVISRPKRRRL